MQKIYENNHSSASLPVDVIVDITHVKSDICNHEINITPVVAVENVEIGRKELVRRTRAAE